jgi:Protein of unknown function (DUF3040)
VLSDREQRVLDELERCYLAGPAAARPSAAPSRPRRRRSGRQPLTLVVIASSGPLCLFLLLSGAAVGAAAIAAATALGWLLWRYWPELAEERPTVPVSEAE